MVSSLDHVRIADVPAHATRKKPASPAMQRVWEERF
jgi:hypothetical protein